MTRMRAPTSTRHARSDACTREQTRARARSRVGIACDLRQNCVAGLIVQFDLYFDIHADKVRQQPKKKGLARAPSQSGALAPSHTHACRTHTHARVPHTHTHAHTHTCTCRTHTHAHTHTRMPHIHAHAHPARDHTHYTLLRTHAHTCMCTRVRAYVHAHERACAALGKVTASAPKVCCRA